MAFFKCGLLVGLSLLLLIDNSCGQVVCRVYPEEKTCEYGQVCCGEMNTECCLESEYKGGYAAIMMIVSIFLVPLILLVLACCLVCCCCCWYFNRRRRNNQGVVYRQAATMDGTSIVSFPPNRVLYIPQPNQNQAMSPYGASAPVYRETTQMLSPADSPYATVNDHLKLVNSEA